MEDDGFRERLGWADAQDALLVLDLNADGLRGAGDGRIDQAKEVVLSLWGDAGMTDMEALAKARDANDQIVSRIPDLLISRVRSVSADIIWWRLKSPFRTFLCRRVADRVTIQ